MRFLRSPFGEFLLVLAALAGLGFALASGGCSSSRYVRHDSTEAEVHQGDDAVHIGARSKGRLLFDLELTVEVDVCWGSRGQGLAVLVRLGPVPVVDILDGGNAAQCRDIGQRKRAKDDANENAYRARVGVPLVALAAVEDAHPPPRPSAAWRRISHPARAWCAGFRRTRLQPELAELDSRNNPGKRAGSRRGTQARWWAQSRVYQRRWTRSRSSRARGRRANRWPWVLYA